MFLLDDITFMIIANFVPDDLPLQLHEVFSDLAELLVFGMQLLFLLVKKPQSLRFSVVLVVQLLAEDLYLSLLKLQHLCLLVL